MNTPFGQPRGEGFYEALLDRAVYTSSTRWPEDFDFKVPGAVTYIDLTEAEKKEHGINRPLDWTRKWLAKVENHPWRIKENQERFG